MDLHVELSKDPFKNTDLYIYIVAALVSREASVCENLNYIGDYEPVFNRNYVTNDVTISLVIYVIFPITIK